jgi:hypothetical protein
MKKLFYVTLLSTFTFGILTAATVVNSKMVSFALCNDDTGIEVKHSMEVPFALLSIDCSMPTALTSGSMLGPFDNTGVTIPGGNFNPVSIVNDNVQYFSVNNAFFPPGTDRITVDINPTGAPALGAHEVYIMSNCNGSAAPLPATNITGECFAITPGNYIIMVVSENANAGNFEITATALTAPPATVNVTETGGNVNNDGIVCVGDNFSIAVTTNVNYTYTWTLDGSPLGNTTSTLSVTNAAIADDGLYSITITDNNACEVVVTQTVTVNPLPVVNLTVTENSGNTANDAEVCEGDPFTLNATAGAVTYTWERNGAPIAGSTNTLNIASAAIGVNDGQYEVFYEDANGCINSDVITITVRPNPVTNDTELKECANGAGTGNFTLTDAQLAPGFPATNSNDGADIDNGAANVTVTYHATLANANAGTAAIGPNYTAPNNTIVYARVENNTTGCFTVAEVTLIVNANPTNLEIQNVNNGNSPANFTVCQGDNINLTNSVTTGQAPYTYNWELPNGSTATGINYNSTNADPNIHDGLWTVTVTDANGCTDTDVITITVTPNPSNDDCANAIAINLGNNAGLTNLCATDDKTPCAGTLNQASVWYEYTIGPGIKTLTVSVSGSNHVVEIYEDNCNTSLAGDCDNSVTLDCPEPQTIAIFVSSSSATAGNFSITVAETPVTVPNDLCDNAEVIDQLPICEFFPVNATTTVGACPETFTLAGCALDYSADAIVWYEFTTPSGTTTIELNSITANAYLSIFATCPAAGGTIPGGGCISGATGAPIAVSENTTYYVAIGLDGTTGNVGFNIKYNVTPDNDDPCAGGFAAVDIAGTLTNQDNTCATDDYNCGGPVENTLWYTYELTAPNDQFTVTVTGLTSPSIAVFEPGDPCSPTLVEEDCNGDGEIELSCLQPGIYNIMIGSSAANAGVFSVSVVAAQNPAAPNDACTSAIDLSVDPADICVLIGPLTGSNENACPENLAAIVPPCDFNAEETTWYSFTAPGNSGDTPTMDFEFTSYSGAGQPLMGLFEGTDCSNLTIVDGCNSGLNTVFGNMGPLVAGNTYLIALSSNGDDGGDFEFEIKFNLGPPNDDPCADLSAYDVTGSGSITGTTNCAGGDPTIPSCPAGDQENVIFYQFTIPAVGVRGVHIVITPQGANPYTGGIVAGVVQDACGNGTVVDAECASGTLDYEFDCLPPGDYFLQVSTAGATAGDLRVDYSEIADNGPFNDKCSRADVVTLTNCEFVTVSGTTVDACWETFNAGGCTHGDNPTVYYTFTTPPGATELDFANIPAGTYITILEDCTAGTYLACSEDTNPFENIPVTENTSYILAVGTTNPAGEPFTFDVKVVVPPANDCTPEVIPSGGSPALTSTCCATNPGDPGACPAGNQESTVWFEYQPSPDAKAVDIMFSSGTLSGLIAFEVFTGAPGQDCTGGFTPQGTPYCINAGDYELTVKCEDFATTSIYIKVGSTEAGCGDFGLSFNEPSGCEGAETCEEIQEVLMPMTEGGPVCANSCNNFNCAEGGDCDPEGASVWFAFTVDAMASSAIVQVDGAAFSPIISVLFGPDCASAGGIVACDQASITTFAVQPGSTYYVKVEALNGQNLGDFSMCVNVLFASFPCTEGSELTSVTRPEYPTANQYGPFCPGEEVEFCFSIDFTVAPQPAPDGNNCQWIQGIIPSLGYGWDYVGSSLNAQGPGGNWFWLDQDNVDYNVNSSIYSIQTNPDGVKKLKYGGATAGMPAGTLLPGGWWVVSNGSGATCTNDGDPDNMWGDPFSCNGVQMYDFCITLKVKEYEELENCTINDLDLTLTTVADGETGCWSQISCALSVPIIFDGAVDCSNNFTVDGEDKEICTGGEAEILVVASSPNAEIVLNTEDNPNVTGETLTGVWQNGICQFTDILVNTGTNVEIVKYIFQTRAVGSVCLGPPFELLVTVYPNLEVQFDPAYVCEGSCGTISPNVSGGSGNYVSYHWNTGQNTPSIQVCPLSPTTYFVTVTDDKGCMGTGEVEVDVKPPVQGEMDPDPLSICQDGIDDPGPYMLVNITSGTDPYDIVWNPGGGIYGTTGTQNYPGDLYDFDEENSVASGVPSEMCVHIVDFYGCEADICGEVVIDGAPDVMFTHAPLVCGQNSTVLTANFDFGNSSSFLDRFELFDCEGNLIAIKKSDPSTFNISDLSVNNCFVLHTYTDNGCLDIRTLVVDPPTGVQAVLSSNSPICEGRNAFVSVDNAAAYASFQWSVPGVTTPTLTAQPLVNTIYAVTVTEANGCTDVATFEVIVSPEPNISLLGSLSFCTNSSTTLEAVSLPGSNYTWKNSVPTVISDTSVVNINTGGQYTVEVVSAGGCLVDSTITVVESTSLQVSLNDLTLCDGGVDTLRAGNFFTSYAWSKDNVALPNTTSKLPVNAPGNYCVTVSDASGCTGVGCKTVTNNNTPSINVLQNPVEVCRVNSGVGPTFVNFNTLVSGPAGTWADIEGTGVDLSNLSNVSFLGIPRDTYDFRFVTNTAVSPCFNDTAVINVIVNNCPCPTIAFQDLTLCNDNSSQVNLNTTLLVPGLIRKGVWTLASGPGPLNITNDSLISVNGVAPGVYNLNWQTSASIGACQSTGQHFITVNDAPKVVKKGDRILCNAVAPQGPTSINLDTVLVAGASPGTWMQTAGTAVSGVPVFDVTGMTPGLLTFQYTTTGATAPCTNKTITLNINVRDCTCPLATIERDTLCNGSDVVDLNTLLTTNPVGTTGVWSTTAPAGTLTGSNFNATGVTSGSYKIRYTLTPDPGGACEKFFEQDIVIRRQPFATKINDATACNANTGNGSTSVGLNSLINATPNGTWTQISGTPALTIPANGFVDFTGLTIGNVYEFRYSVTAISPCVPVDVVVKVTVKDCDCPNVAIVAPQPLCNTELTFDLSTLEDPNIAPGFWSVIDPLNKPVTVNPDKTINVNGLAEGKYDLVYTLSPAPSGTCPKSNMVILDIVNEKTAVLKASETVCTVDKGNDDNILDFRDLIVSGYAGGTWSNTDNAPVVFNNPPVAINFSNATIGQTYTFSYSVDNAAPCVDKLYTIEIEVIDCTCPPIKPGDPADVCTSAGTVTLSPQYDDPANPGKWQSVTVPITNNVANVAALASGNYTITYVVNTPTPGCPDRVDRTLTVVKAKSVGTPADDQVCSNEPETISLANLLTGEDAGGNWKEVSAKPSTGNAFNATAGTFNTTGQAASSYQFEYSFSNQTPCPDIKQVVTINIVSAPTAQAGNPDTLSCAVAEVTIGDPTDNQPNVSYQWTHDGGIAVPNADKATAKVNFGGKFTIKVTNSVTGCSATDDVIITVDPNKPTAQLGVKDVSCFNAKDGTVGFINIAGGKAPLQYSKDGGATFQASPNFTGLSGGTYNMVIKDATGCTYLETAKIKEPGPLSIDLGDDVTITLGETVPLSLQGQIPANIQTIQWSVTDTAGVRIICDQPVENCVEFTFTPLISSVVCAMITDQNGCEAEDCKNINLLKARNVIFSNILQAGNLGENKTFYVESNSVAWIKDMKIYDRWGNLMYQRSDFPANDPAYGWNGTFNGTDVVQGVYTWVVELEYDSKGSGDLEVFSGDLTVIR